MCVKESTSCVQELMGSCKESTSCVQDFMGASRRAQAVFKSSWGRKGEHMLCSRVNVCVKESTSCVQELMGALRRAQAVFKSSWGVLRRAQAVFKSSWGRSGEHKLCSRVHGGVKESTSCVQEFMWA